MADIPSDAEFTREIYVLRAEGMSWVADRLEAECAARKAVEEELAKLREAYAVASAKLAACKATPT